jgi:hypothetical protein
MEEGVGEEMTRRVDAGSLTFPNQVIGELSWSGTANWPAVWSAGMKARRIFPEPEPQTPREPSKTYEDFLNELGL